MNHITILKKIKEDLEKNVASKSKSKIPDDEKNDENYVVQTRPYSVYIGTMIPDRDVDESIPSLMLSIKDAKRNDKRSIFTLEIDVALWSPGTYESQNYIAVEDENALGGVHFVENELEKEVYTSDESGYIELWNMIDKILDYISKKNLLAGYKIDKENITYDQFRDSEGYAINFYPYYMGYIYIPLIVEEKYIEKDIRDLL